MMRTKGNRAARVLGWEATTTMSADQFDALVDSLYAADDAGELTAVAGEPRRFAR